jgi:hypothetical protein
VEKEANPRTEPARNHRAALKVRKLLLVSAMMAIGLAQSARADTTYSYNGNHFADFKGYTCPAVCSISRSFRLSSPLGADHVIHST